jgi:hypothetical protein
MFGDWGSISDQRVVTYLTGGSFEQSSITINGGSAISYGHTYPTNAKLRFIYIL